MTDGGPSIAYWARTVTSPRTAACASLLAVALVAAPARAAAMHEPASAAPSVDASEAQATSRALFRDGLAAFERDDVATAIQHWTNALAAIEHVPELEDARHVLELALGQAHVRAYELDGERAHLRIARPLIASYLDWSGREGHELTDAEREDRPRALTLLARVDILLEPRTTATRTTPKREPLGEPRRETPSAEAQRRSATAMIAGGGVAIGLATLALAGTFGGFGRAQVTRNEYTASVIAMQREEEPQSQERLDSLIEANKRGVILGAMSVIVLVAGTAVGVPLLVKGMRTRQRIRADVSVARGSAHARLGFAF